jgi:DNA-binding transcriptional MerR regulator
MVTYSTRQVAKRLGITDVALGHYIKVGKIPAPKIMAVGNRNVHAWSEVEIEHVRKLLPKIANGRKTRYKKKQLATGSQQLAKAKTRKPKKK